MELYNQEAENYVLGCIIEDSRCHDNVFGIISADDFKGEKQRIVFEALESLKRDNKSIDSLVLMDDLRDKGKLDMIGGSQFLSGLTTNVIASNVSFWVSKVKDLKNRRSIVQMCHEVLDMAKSDSETIHTIVTSIDKTLLGINEKTGFGYQAISELLPPIMCQLAEDCLNKGQIKGIRSGIQGLDNLTMGFQDSDYWIIGARPSVGKTASALQIIINAAMKECKVGLISAEMNKTAIVKRMLSNIANVSGSAVNSGMIGRQQMVELNHAADILMNKNIFIDDTPNIELGLMKATARKMVRKNGIKILFIDYIGLIGYSTGNSVLNRREIIGEISRQIKGLARELQIPIIALSQLNRDANEGQPTMANLRDSGDLEQDADGIILLHRTSEKNQDDDDLLFILEKQRNGPVGIVNIKHKKAVGKMLEVIKDSYGN